MTFSGGLASLISNFANGSTQGATPTNNVTGTSVAQPVTQGSGGSKATDCPPWAYCVDEDVLNTPRNATPTMGAMPQPSFDPLDNTVTGLGSRNMATTIFDAEQNTPEQRERLRKAMEAKLGNMAPSVIDQHPMDALPPEMRKIPMPPPGLEMQQASIGFMQPMQQGLRQVSNQIDNLGDSMNSGFQQLIKQEQQSASPYAAPQSPFPTLPSMVTPSPFGSSLFGGIAPFLMNRYAAGGLVKKGGRVAAEAMGKSAETIMRNKQVREEIKAIKAQMQKNDDIARDISMGEARGKARAANEALEPKLKALQDEFMELFKNAK
jgi:hypothetical protein